LCRVVLFCRVNPITKESIVVWTLMITNQAIIVWTAETKSLLPSLCKREELPLFDKWVVLLSFSASALKYAARDRWIGLDLHHQYDRLKLIVNNSRFLILPDLNLFIGEVSEERYLRSNCARDREVTNIPEYLS